MADTKTAFYLVPGAFCPPYYYHKIEPALRERGHFVESVDLPSKDAARRAKGESPGLYDDADFVRAKIQERFKSPDKDISSMDVILVGSSYGGTVIYEACKGLIDEDAKTSGNDGHGKIKHLVLLGSLPANDGLSVVDLLKDYGAPAPPSGETSSMWLDAPPPEQTGPAFFGGLSKEEQDHYASMTQAMCGLPFTHTLTCAAWRKIPSTYLMGTEDKMVPIDFQYRIFDEAVESGVSHLQKVVLHGADHLLMLSRPQEVINACLEAAGDA